MKGVDHCERAVPFILVFGDFLQHIRCRQIYAIDVHLYGAKSQRCDLQDDLRGR